MFGLIAGVLFIVGGIVALGSIAVVKLWLFVVLVIGFFLFGSDNLYWIALIIIMSWAFITVFTFTTWAWLWVAIMICAGIENIIRF